MNRLQKKCVIATAGVHLLLLTILVVGPAFYNPQPKPDNTQVLDVIPANLIDAAFNSGVRNAAPPPPAPVVAPPPQPQQQQPLLAPPPPLPKPPVPPPPEPTPSLTERVEKLFKPEPRPEVKPEPVRPAPKPPTVEPHKIQPNLTPVIRNAPRTESAAQAADDSQRQQRLRQQAIQNAVRSLRSSLAPAMTVDMPGDSSVAYANYASVVKSVYEQAWIPPDTARDDANTKVRVTIARDGTVISARIIESSGDPATDDSVQRTLDRVKIIAPFPDDSTDRERTYVINFNLKAKRALE